MNLTQTKQLLLHHCSALRPFTGLVFIVNTSGPPASLSLTQSLGKIIKPNVTNGSVTPPSG